MATDALSDFLGFYAASPYPDAKISQILHRIFPDSRYDHGHIVPDCSFAGTDHVV